MIAIEHARLITIFLYTFYIIYLFEISICLFVRLSLFCHKIYSFRFGVIITELGKQVNYTILVRATKLGVNVSYYFTQIRLIVNLVHAHFRLR